MQEFAAGNPTAVTTSSYRYDGLGRRIEKVANGQATRYIYDGEDILLEYDGANVLQARYTHGPGIDEPIAVTQGASTFFYHQDGLGTVTELTDSTGNVAKAYAYDAYGNILEAPGAVNQPYTYTGRELDSETGLYYYRARCYDPPTGRFLQNDPVGFRGGDINLYRYVSNNPIYFRDPLGLQNTAVFPGTAAGSAAQQGASAVVKGALQGIGSGLGTVAGAITGVIVFPDVAGEGSNIIPLPDSYPDTLLPDDDTVPDILLSPYIDIDTEIACPVDPLQYSPHKKKRPSTYDKHTKPRPGRPTEKQKQKPGCKPFNENKRRP